MALTQGDPGAERSWGVSRGHSSEEARRKPGGAKGRRTEAQSSLDHVNHDILMTRIGKKIRDKRVLRLIGRYLRAGVMIEGVVQESEEGTPQGGPLSPFLANIYLDVLDQELERRGLAFCRYADDCNIYVSSPRAAERVLESITHWIQKHLRLEVNATKSGIGRPWERKFLGFTINPRGAIEVSAKSVEGFREKVREMWRSCQSLSSTKLRDRWRTYVRGWWAYYGLAEDRRNVLGLEGWIRRHIRTCFWRRWHNWRGRLRKLRALGLQGRLLKVAPQFQGAWRIAASPSLQTALSNAVLRRYGFWMPSDLAPAMSIRRCVQPPDAENRTSGGVGGCRGAIPGTRPDRSGGWPRRRWINRLTAAGGLW